MLCTGSICEEKDRVLVWYYYDMTIFLLIVGFIWILTLHNRISKLEKGESIHTKAQQKPLYDPKQVAELQQQQQQQQKHAGMVSANSSLAPKTAEVHQVVPSISAAPKAPPLPQQQYMDASRFDLFDWLKRGFLIKFGAFLLFLGVAWFVSYAFSEGWVSPTMRIMLGLVLALCVYGLSEWRFAHDRTQGIILNALGTAVVMSVVTAAQFVYEMFPSVLALAIMVLSVTYTVFVSLRYTHELLAVTAAIAGLVAPLLTNQTLPDMVSFFMYLLVYTIAFVWVATKVQWSSLILTLLLGVGAYQLLYYSGDTIDNTLVFLVFTFVFGFVFYISSLIGGLVQKKVTSADIYIGAINSTILLLWTYVLVPDFFQSSIAFVIAVIAAATTYTLIEYKLPKQLIYLHGGIASVFLIAATAFEFSGYTLTMMYTLESGLVIAIFMLVRAPEKVVSFASWSFALPILLSFESFSARAWHTGWLHPDAYTLYVILAVTAIIFNVAHYRVYMQIKYTFLTLFWIYATILITLITNSLLSGTTAFAVMIFGYTLLSTAGVCIGLFRVSGERLIQALVGTYLLPGIVVIGLLLKNDLWRDSWVHIESVSIVFFMVMLSYVGYLVLHVGKLRNQAHELGEVGKGMIVCAGAILIFYIWRFFHSIFERDDVAVTAALFVYVIAGLAIYMLGRNYNNREMRVIGGFLLGSVVLRLLLVDVWHMEILWRVVTFGGVGALFIATSFLESKNIKRLVTDESQNE